MKLYRKLTTVLLAGVVALTVLTGCKTVAPKAAEDKYAEYIAIMNDCLKSGKGPEWDMAKAKEFKQDINMNAIAQNAAKIMQGENVRAELKGLLVKDEKDTNIYKIAYAKNVAYESAYFNGRKQYELVENLFENLITLNVNDDYIEKEDVVVLTGFAEVKVKEDTYIVVVMQIPTELQAQE